METDYDEQEAAICDVCNGEGEIIACVDDACRNSGYCNHRRDCPACNGSGEK